MQQKTLGRNSKGCILKSGGKGACMQYFASESVVCVLHTFHKWTMQPLRFCHCGLTSQMRWDARCILVPEYAGAHYWKKISRKTGINAAEVLVVLPWRPSSFFFSYLENLTAVLKFSIKKWCSHLLFYCTACTISNLNRTNCCRKIEVLRDYVSFNKECAGVNISTRVLTPDPDECAFRNAHSSDAARWATFRRIHCSWISFAVES